MLGALILDGETLISVSERLRPEDFYRQSHQMIYEAMIALGDRQEPVDLVTIAAELKDREQLEEIGGITYLTELGQCGADGGQRRLLCAHRGGKSTSRRLIRTATQIVKQRLQQRRRCR